MILDVVDHKPELNLHRFIVACIVLQSFHSVPLGPAAVVTFKCTYDRE